MSTHARDDDDGTVPVAVVAALLQSVSGMIHDRPVQQLVAGQLMVQTGHDAGTPGLVQRGLTAITNAGVQSRQIMWALDRPEVRPGHVTEDLTDTLAVGQPEAADPPRVTVALDGDEEVAQVAALVAALHDTAVDAMVAGHVLVEVAVASDAEGIEATVASDGAERPPGPWITLARHRLVAVGGDVTVRADGDRRITVLRIG